MDWRLYHYYDRSTGPFLNLSQVSDEEAASIQAGLAARPEYFASKRPAEYLGRRRELETLARRLFMEAGGRPRTSTPQYLVLGACPWIETWFPDPAWIRIVLDTIPEDCISFSYGDLFPSFSPRCADGREYRGRIYTRRGIEELVGRLGLPQDWNPDGTYGPERYVEAQLWDDAEKYVSVRA